MRHWRKHIICLLLVTFPVSLWAAVAVPQDCASHQSDEQVQATRIEHAHHADHANSGMSGGEHPVPLMNGDDGHFSGPCCDTCLSACLASSLTVLDLQLAVPEPVIPAMHFKLDRATQFLAGPSYPSLYRPPIAHS